LATRIRHHQHALLWITLIGWYVPAFANYTVTPGFLYTPSDGTARQFSPSLQLVGDGGPNDNSGTTGAAISKDGLFLFEAYRKNIPGLPDGAHLLALGNGGTLVHELLLTTMGLNRASGIGVDSTGRIYASAADGLHQISADFSTNTVLPVPFGRASGVAVAPNDFLYVTDQNANSIRIINANRQSAGSIPTGRVPSGVTFAPDHFLYYTDTPFVSVDYQGRLVKVDPVTLQQTVVFNNLPFPMDVEFAPDGSYYLATFTGREIDHYSANNVVLHSFSDGSIMDQLAFYAPEPAAMGVIVGMLALGMRIRRATTPATISAANFGKPGSHSRAVNGALDHANAL
jgi:YVTN family beta-propeller protein